MASEHELNYHFNAGGAHGRTAIDPLDLFAVSRFADEESIPANFRDLFRFFIDTMNDSAVILSPDGSVLYGNRAFSAMMGRSQHELLGARFAAWVADECQTAFAQLLSGSPSASRSALQLLRSDGLRVPVQLAVNALDGSGYPGFLGIVVFDRTEELFGLALQLERQAAREREQMPCE